MSKEMYHYEQIRQKLEAQKAAEKSKREEERRTKELTKKREEASKLLVQPAVIIEEEVKGAPASPVGPTERTGDPFKDF